MANKITEKQKRFCDEYLVDRNATQAAIRAGYSKKTAISQASRLLTKVNVRDYVLEKALEQSKAIAEKTQIDAAWVLIEQKRVYDMCMDQELEFKNASSANKALENIGKHVDVNAFKATDDDGVPIDQNWVLTIVDAKPNDSKKAGKTPVGKKAK